MGQLKEKRNRRRNLFNSVSFPTFSPKPNWALAKNNVKILPKKKSSVFFFNRIQKHRFWNEYIKNNNNSTKSSNRNIRTSKQWKESPFHQDRSFPYRGKRRRLNPPWPWLSRVRKPKASLSSLPSAFPSLPSSRKGGFGFNGSYTKRLSLNRSLTWD